MGQPNSDLPLDGITVVALEQAVAAPLATRHLADMGARVIKIERVGEGDFARHYDQAVHGQASHFVWLNRSKESIAVDVKSDPRPADPSRSGRASRCVPAEPGSRRSRETGGSARRNCAINTHGSS